MSVSTLVGRDIFVRHTDEKGNTHVMNHRVWDADLFMATRRHDAAVVNASSKVANPKAAAEQITEEQFRIERK